MTQTHASAMDRMYRVQRHIYDVTRKYYLLGRDRLVAELQPGDGETILEVGCGTGRNLAAVARRYPRARLYGFDISAEMLKSAEAAVRKVGAEARVSLAQGDATAFDPSVFGASTPVQGFDRVFISYALSMIPDWQGALNEGIRLTAPGGRLAVVDFGACENLPGFAKAGLYRWLDAFHVTPRETLQEAAEDCAQAQGARAQFSSLYGGYAAYLRIEK